MTCRGNKNAQNPSNLEFSSVLRRVATIFIGPMQSHWVTLQGIHFSVQQIKQQVDQLPNLVGGLFGPYQHALNLGLILEIQLRTRHSTIHFGLRFRWNVCWYPPIPAIWKYGTAKGRFVDSVPLSGSQSRFCQSYEILNEYETRNIKATSCCLRSA